jgi:hypothetical protein
VVLERQYPAFNKGQKLLPTKLVQKLGQPFENENSKHFTNIRPFNPPTTYDTDRYRSRKVNREVN